ncbi:MAG: hypothetical protein QXV32_03810 [Conexivisphaerales archaeon]
MTKADLVTLMSLGVAGLSAILMLMVWKITVFLEPFWHGIISLAAWVVGFVLGCMLLWSAVIRFSNRKSGNA